MNYEKEKYEKLFKKLEKQGDMWYGDNSFKINLFMEKAESSLQIAQHHKNIQPNKDQSKNYTGITGQ